YNPVSPCSKEVLFLWWQWHKHAGTADIITVLRLVLLQVLFQQRRAGYSYQQQGHQHRAEDRPPAAHRQRKTVETPPHQRITKAIRMPGIAPQPAVQLPPLIGRVVPESSKLPVAHRLKKEADTPQCSSEVIQLRQLRRSRAVQGDNQRHSDQPHQRTLQQ